MVNTEALAKWVGDNSPKRDEISGTKNSLVPPLPKPGEVIICQQCGKPMYPEDFSKDPKIRKHEFKWHIHHACEQQLLDLCDINTPGLLSERHGNISNATARSLAAMNSRINGQPSMVNKGSLK